VSVFIDLSKAFDNVDHAVLVQRLKCCGMTGHALDWFSNYLLNHTQCVLELCSGVPKGSIFGPINQQRRIILKQRMFIFMQMILFFIQVVVVFL
jgi:hypothetical protein